MNSNIVFPDHPAPDVSSQYVHIDTNQFISAMAQEGFSVAQVRRDRARSRDPLYARHMIRFEHDTPDVREDVRPQIIFINSHNRTTRATVAMGLIRFACFNGMVTGDIAHRATVRHAGDAARELIAKAAEMAKDTTRIYRRIEEWSRKELTLSQAHDLARRAAAIRWGERWEQYPTDALLAPRRAEDEGMDLWRVFNRIQENITKPGVAGLSANGRRILTRELTEIGVDMRVNAQLWSAAEELAA